jgi:hypothetical protein
MKILRRIMSRPLSGGVVAAAMMYVLLLQSVVGAIAQGAMSYPIDGQPSVICFTSSETSGAGESSSQPDEGELHKFCATLCQLSCVRSVSLHDAPSIPQRPDLSHEIIVAIELLLPIRKRERTHVAEARAPPQQS